MKIPLHKIHGMKRPINSVITHRGFDEDGFGVHANVEYDFEDDEDDPSQPLNPHEPRELFDFY